jgi:predicted nucleic acid-binding protein
VIYLDTSAIVKLLIEEDESMALHETLSGEDTPPVFTSQLAITEVKWALHARSEAELAAQVVAPAQGLLVPGQAILARPVTAQILTAAGDLSPGSALRSLDAIHLATAQTAGATLTALITYDRRMADAATALDLCVLTPGRTD